MPVCHFLLVPSDQAWPLHAARLEGTLPLLWALLFLCLRVILLTQMHESLFWTFSSEQSVKNCRNAKNIPIFTEEYKALASTLLLSSTVPKSTQLKLTHTVQVPNKRIICNFSGLFVVLLKNYKPATTMSVPIFYHSRPQQHRQHTLFTHMGYSQQLQHLTTYCVW